MGQSWISVTSMQLQHWEHCISHPWGVNAKGGELKMPFWTYVRTTVDRRSVKESLEIKPSAVFNLKYVMTFIPILSSFYPWTICGLETCHAEDNKLIKTGNVIFLLLTCQNFCRKVRIVHLDSTLLLSLNWVKLHQGCTVHTSHGHTSTSLRTVSCWAQSTC